MLFKCKNCKSIFTKEIYPEVIRFVDTVIHNDTLWPKICVISDDPYDHSDRYGCSINSYYNASGQFENYIRDDLNFTEDQVQKVVNKTLEFIIESNGNVGR